MSPNKLLEDPNLKAAHQAWLNSHFTKQFLGYLTQLSGEVIEKAKHISGQIGRAPDMARYLQDSVLLDTIQAYARDHQKFSADNSSITALIRPVSDGLNAGTSVANGGVFYGSRTAAGTDAE